MSALLPIVQPARDPSDRIKTAQQDRRTRKNTCFTQTVSIEEAVRLPYPAREELRLRPPNVYGGQGLKGFSDSNLKPRRVEMREIRLIDDAVCRHLLYVQVENLVLLFDGDPCTIIASAEQVLRLAFHELATTKTVEARLERR